MKEIPEQRFVACPSCGHIMFDIGQIFEEDETSVNTWCFVCKQKLVIYKNTSYVVAKGEWS